MFTSGDLDYMRAAQQSHMMDVCHRLVWSSSQNDSGEPVDAWSEISTDVPCGLDQRPSSERRGAEFTVVTFDATIRLPLSAAEWDPKDRIKIVSRFGELITPLVYGIAGPIQRGPSGVRLLLARVEV